MKIIGGVFSFFALLILFKTNGAVSDSLVVEIKARNGNDLTLAYIDEFSSRYALALGINNMPKKYVIQDHHWKKDITYPIPDSIKKVSIVYEDNFWVLKTSDEKLNKFVNFEVCYRKSKDQITDIQFPFVKYNNSKGKILFKNDEERDSTINRVYDEKLAYLDEYSKINKMQLEQQDFWKTIIKYQRIQDLLFLLSYEEHDKTYLTKLLALRTEFVNDELLNYQFYKIGLGYLADLMDYYYFPNSNKLTTKYEVLKSEFTSNQRDFLMTTMLLNAKYGIADSTVSTAEYIAVLKDYYIICEKLSYKNQLVRVNQDINITNGDNLIKVNKIIIDFKEVIAKSRYTYVDFWASWCAPCLLEMPESMKLKSEFEKKGIKFIYVSIDDNQNSWRSAIKKIGLNENDNYLLPFGKESILGKKIQISTIPRYIILDENGDVVDKDAIRPSDKKIRLRLNNLLKNSLK